MAGADANLGRSPFAAGRNENNNIYLSERLEREREREREREKETGRLRLLYDRQEYNWWAAAPK